MTQTRGSAKHSPLKSLTNNELLYYINLNGFEGESMALRNFVGRMLSPAYGDHIRETVQKPVVLGLLEKRGKVLDAGCGSGLYTREVKAEQCIAFDYSLEHLNSLLPGSQARPVNGDLQKLPFKKRSFDSVLCLEVLEHLKDDRQALKEIKRVLKAGGELLLSVPLLPAPIKDSEHVREGYTPQGVKRMLEKEGFKVLKEDYCLLAGSRAAFKLLNFSEQRLGFRPPAGLIKLISSLDRLCLGEKRLWRPYDLVLKCVLE
jgi:SAM-dependent methyltransferase